MEWKQVILEMSLKPFANEHGKNCESILRRLFTQWRALTEQADEVGIMLWVGDGSEILEYGGRLDEVFEWARYIGCINREPSEEYLKMDPDCEEVHSRAQLYRDDLPEFTYAFLKDLVSTIKRVGNEVTGKPIIVGETFDPGPEFAKSPFRYERHPEIVKGGFGGKIKDVISCYTNLHADDKAYAAFPEGIPEGTPFGTFLGKQTTVFFDDLGFDFIWFSNGFGFGNYPWSYNGELFDLETFQPEKQNLIAEQNLEFWKVFKDACSYPVMVRGTNVSTGVDLASDGVPLKQIYESGCLPVPPVNSPWVALNRDAGIELAGWMSHIAEIPGEGYPFRFYTLDPWWPTKPWLLLYEREAYDIYMPMAVSRMNGEGQVELPSSINFLSVDTQQGEIPDQVPEEVIPHLADAMRHAPDEPGPLVWVYPFDEYHEWIKPDSGRIDEVMFGDLFIRDAMNQGLPLNTVLSTTNLVATMESNPEALSGRVLVSPVPEAGSQWERTLLSFAEQGGCVFLYGPLRHAGNALRDLLGIELSHSLEGPMALELAEGACADVQILSPAIAHKTSLSAGGVEETGGTSALAQAKAGDQLRTYAAEADHGDGKLVWLRGSIGGEKPYQVDETEWLRGGQLMATMLTPTGWNLRWQRSGADVELPTMTIARNENAFYFSGMNRNTLVDHHFRAPFGAPLLTNMDVRIEEGRSVYRLPASWHRECRIFVEQDHDSDSVTCHQKSSPLRHSTRWMVVRGLKEATLSIFPEPGTESNLCVRINAGFPYVNQEQVETAKVTENGWTYHKTTKPITGSAIVSW